MQDCPGLSKLDEPPTLKFQFPWEGRQAVSSRLFYRHQEDKLTASTLEQLTEGESSTVNSLFLRMSIPQSRQQCLSGGRSDLLLSTPRRLHDLSVEIECAIDIYRDFVH
ncbi:hypothetical protein M405DRAFT_833057 [Rhizopogon salebrosus TDB-379]|nr:hypothetical protein M405DRAFT_833057 [Rhizopogon salebrosus TDB-379]